MLSRTMYTSEYINDLYKKTGNDPTLLERVVYAFGLLEAIKRVGLPKFKYRSPRSERNVTILLDVLFEKIQYKTCILKPIKNELLLTEGEDLSVSIPNVNGILGDKMTAFAPHTTGILFGGL